MKQRNLNKKCCFLSLLRCSSFSSFFDVLSCFAGTLLYYLVCIGLLLLLKLPSACTFLFSFLLFISLLAFILSTFLYYFLNFDLFDLARLSLLLLLSLLIFTSLAFSFIFISLYLSFSPFSLDLLPSARGSSITISSNIIASTVSRRSSASF